MKIVCDACQAKYSISDDVKIGQEAAQQARR